MCCLEIGKSQNQKDQLTRFDEEANEYVAIVLQHFEALERDRVFVLMHIEEQAKLKFVRDVRTLQDEPVQTVRVAMNLEGEQLVAN